MTYIPNIIISNYTNYNQGEFMKDFLQLACERYSVRKYSDKQIEEEKLEKILKAAQVAPTGNNF
jgi:hypothetical protein